MPTRVSTSPRSDQPSGWPRVLTAIGVRRSRRRQWATKVLSVESLESRWLLSGVPTGQSEWAYYGESGRLIQPLDSQGNRLPDFSTAGYLNGNAPLPNVSDEIDLARVIHVAPGPGDDTALIQAAIDEVGLMPANAAGLRGVVQLSAGEFEVGGHLSILRSGVVLRGVGDGDDPTSNTILRATGTEQRSLIQVGEASAHTEIVGTRHNVIDKYVPVGATSLLVDSTIGWNVGDEVIVHRPATAEWIEAIGMTTIVLDNGEVYHWEPGVLDHLLRARHHAH